MPLQLGNLPNNLVHWLLSQYFVVLGLKYHAIGCKTDNLALLSQVVGEAAEWKLYVI